MVASSFSRAVSKQVSSDLGHSTLRADATPSSKQDYCNYVVGLKLTLSLTFELASRLSHVLSYAAVHVHSHTVVVTAVCGTVVQLARSATQVCVLTGLLAQRASDSYTYSRFTSPTM